MMSIWKRSIGPAAMLLAVMAMLFAGYRLVPSLPPGPLHTLAAIVTFWGYTLSVAAGILWIYPRAGAGGASLPERLAVSLLNPAVWALKEAVRVGSIYGMAKGAYFLLGPFNIQVYAMVLALCGLGEIRLRRRLVRRGQNVRVGHPAAIAAVVAGTSLAIFIVAWGLGVHSFYLFQEGYKWLFY